jgi:hypothetical protein
MDEDAGASPDSGDSPSAAFADSSAFADADVFDITGETSMSDLADEVGGSPDDPGDETIDEGATAVFDSPLVPDAEDFDEDEEDLGVDINLDAVGADGQAELIDDGGTPAVDEAFDAEASAFFEDITVGPVPDYEEGPTPDTGDEQSSLDAKLEQATAILDGTVTPGDADEAGDFGEMETTANSGPAGTEDPNDFTLEQFIETDSFDAPETIPPAMPKTDARDDSGDVTLDAFMSTSMFEGVELTNEDETVLPEFVPDEGHDLDGVDAGDTVVIDRSKDKKDEDDDGSEDPTVVK